MMHLLRKNDVAPLRSAMMRCLPQCAARHTSLGEAVIIGVANIICRRQTSFKKAQFVWLTNWAFLLAGAGGFEPATHGFGVALNIRKTLRILDFSPVSSHFPHKTVCHTCV